VLNHEESWEQKKVAYSLQEILLFSLLLYSLFKVVCFDYSFCFFPGPGPWVCQGVDIGLQGTFYCLEGRLEIRFLGAMVFKGFSTSLGLAISGTTQVLDRQESCALYGFLSFLLFFSWLLLGTIGFWLPSVMTTSHVTCIIRDFSWTENSFYDHIFPMSWTV